MINSPESTIASPFCLTPEEIAELRSLPWSAAIERVYRKIATATETSSHQEEQPEEVSVTIAVLFILFLLALRVPGFTAVLTPADEKMAKAALILEKYHWWPFPSLTVNSCYEIVGKEFELDDRKVSDLVLGFVNGNECSVLKEMVQGWSDIAFMRRVHIFKDALYAHERELYTLSIPTLIPHIEGIIRERLGQLYDFHHLRFAQTREEFKRRTPVLSAIPQYEHGLHSWEEANMVVNYTILQAIDRLFTKFEPEVEYRDEMLNRHALCHGTWLSYSTCENSTRLFLLLDALHGVITALEKTNLLMEETQ